MKNGGGDGENDEAGMTHDGVDQKFPQARVLSS
jgi:hypothetical protein